MPCCRRVFKQTLYLTMFELLKGSIRNTNCITICILAIKGELNGESFLLCFFLLLGIYGGHLAIGQ